MVDKSEKEPEKSEKTDAPEKKEHKKKKPQEPQRRPPQEAEKPGFKGIVRLAGRDIRGHVKLRYALDYIQGFGPTMSVAVAKVLNDVLHISSDVPIGELDESQVENIDKILFNLHNYNLPKYLFNRNRDYNSGPDRHVIMNDLIFSLKQDVEKERKAYTWRGYRHAYGQKVRGQRTRNTGRTGMAVGVMRKTILAATAAAKEGKEGAPAVKAGPAAPAAAPAGGKAASPTAPKAAPAAAPKGSAEKSEKK